MEDLRQNNQSLSHSPVWGPNDPGNCQLCRNVGWLLEAKQKGPYVTLELIPCLIPDCQHSGKRIELLSINDLGLTKIATNPQTGVIMSVFCKGCE